MEKRKRGRPPLGPYSGKRKNFTTRITAEGKLRLQNAAKSAGRSLSQEIEYRLERSFLMDDVVAWLDAQKQVTEK